MNDITLTIIQEDGLNGDCRYTFILHEPNRDPVVGKRAVSADVHESLIEQLQQINSACDLLGKAVSKKEALRIYVRRANDEELYVKKVEKALKNLSMLLRSAVWPDFSDNEGKAFARRFREIEKSCAKLSQPPHLTIMTNSPALPWWITSCNHDKTRIIGDIFGVGIVSTRSSKTPTRRAAPTPPIRVCFVTCPTMDLVRKSHRQSNKSKAKEVHKLQFDEVEIDELAKELKGVANYKLLSGRRLNGSYTKDKGWQDGKGVSKRTLIEGIKNADVILYHGHFKSHKEVSKGELKVSLPPPHHENNEVIPIENLPLDNKDVVLIACESASMSYGTNETLGEYLSERGSKLVGTLYPILDAEARAFANALSRNLFQEYLSWGESVRKARSTPEFGGTLFHRAAYCHFGVPSCPSPVFNHRKQLDILVPQYLESVFNLIAPNRVYSSDPNYIYVSPSDLEKSLVELDKSLTEKPGNLLLAAVPVAYLQSTFRKHLERWIILAPMVASTGDVYLTSSNPKMDFLNPDSWRQQKLVTKGLNLTATAFVEVLLSKHGIHLRELDVLELTNDCIQYLNQSKDDVGLVVVREDLEPGKKLPGETHLSVDTLLSEKYSQTPIPRIVWIVRRECMEGLNKLYIDEFFLSLSRRVSEESNTQKLTLQDGTQSASNVYLYSLGNRARLRKAREVLCAFTKDWADLDPDKRKALTEEDFHVWS